MVALIKPVSGACDMRCSYCFYRDTADRRAVRAVLMSVDTLRETVREAVRYSPARCDLIFQGGEPTLAGLDFYRALVEIERDYPETVFLHSIQTNGLNIDGEWAKFFEKYGFLVGLSLDGVKKTHDLYRVQGKSGTYERVVRAAEILRKNGVKFNILTVVTPEIDENIVEIYTEYIKRGYLYQQYIPQLGAFGKKSPLTAKAYGDFLCELFDLWHADFTGGKDVFIRYFDDLAQVLAGLPAPTCGMCGACAPQFVVEADGSVYPCDFYVAEEYRLGSVKDGFAALSERREKSELLRRSRNVPEKCEKCGFYTVCKNGCLRERGGDGVNERCEAYRRFFVHALPRLQKLI